MSGGFGQISENGVKRYNVGDVIKIKYPISDPPHVCWESEEVTILEVKADGTYKISRKSGGISDFPGLGLWLDE